MKITIRICNEDEIDFVDLLGVIIIDKEQNTIKAECVYVDSFLCSLIQGIIILKRGKSSHIDLVEEPHPLEIIHRSDLIEISYLQSTVKLNNINELENALIKTINYLFEKIGLNTEAFKIPTIKFMKDFVEHKQILDSDFVQPVIKEW